MKRTNSLGQKIGFEVEGWTRKEFPTKIVLEGSYCTLKPLNPQRHALELFEANSKSPSGKMWTYLPMGPFDDLDRYNECLIHFSEAKNAVHFAIVDKKTERAVGTFCLTKINPENGVVEIGLVAFSPDLQRTTMSTEACYLLMKYVFETLGYRRCEWKCDTFNEPSKRAAMRLGFKLDGTFRQGGVYKGRNRDEHWLSIINGEWEVCRMAFEQWLCTENFNYGIQKSSLWAIRDSITAGTPDRV